MAVVDGLPARQIILAFRGTLDYYVWRGQVCVRSWPRPPQSPRSPAVRAAGAAFGDFSRRLAHLDPFLLEAAKLEVKGSGYTWKDLLTSAAYGRLVSW